MKVAFDVDGTLYKVVDGLEIPRWNVIDLMKHLSDLGAYIICHSGGGDWYAEKYCKSLLLDGIIDEYRTKGDPNVVICDISFDDELVTYGTVNFLV